MNKFALLTIVYIILGILTFPLLESFLMADEAGVFGLLVFIFMCISGVWALATSSYRLFLLFTLFYIPLTWLIARDADQNMFGPSRDQTILVAVLVYVVLILIWFGVKYLKKRLRK